MSKRLPRGEAIAERLQKKTASYKCAVSLIGGAPLLLGVPPYPVEVYNDIDSTVAFFFGCLQHHGRKRQLKDLLKDYTGFEDRALLALYRDRKLSQAVRLSSWYAFGAALLRPQLEKLQTKKLFNRGGGDYEVFSKKVAEGLYDELRDIDPLLPDFHGRLFRMQVEHYPVDKVVKIYDSPETVFVVDEDHDEDVDETWDALGKIQGAIFAFSVDNSASASFLEPRGVKH